MREFSIQPHRNPHSMEPPKCNSLSSDLVQSVGQASPMSRTSSRCRSYRTRGIEWRNLTYPRQTR